jgi:hypothetical protein
MEHLSRTLNLPAVSKLHLDVLCRSIFLKPCPGRASNSYVVKVDPWRGLANSTPDNAQNRGILSLYSWLTWEFRAYLHAHHWADDHCSWWACLYILTRLASQGSKIHTTREDCRSSESERESIWNPKRQTQEGASS